MTETATGTVAQNAGKSTGSMISTDFDGPAGGGEDTILLVTFVLGDQTYGGDILQIQEVSGVSHITRVPHVKDYIKGVTNLRGNIVPTIDLRTRLNIDADKGDASSQQVMIARTSQGLIGYIVDAVREVISVPKDTIEPTPEDWLDADHKYFVGIAKMEDILVTIVDFNRVIQADGALADEFKAG
ncbi:MAG: purine-binding chemotaxis protein CheW [Candidatus Marinimicrobia bacterium]|nr:purine-binding chemotaxis protein CheW [Candidatus Neomarinimicrobiota bacterium]